MLVACIFLGPAPDSGLDEPVSRRTWEHELPTRICERRAQCMADFLVRPEDDCVGLQEAWLANAADTEPCYNEAAALVCLELLARDAAEPCGDAPFPVVPAACYQTTWAEPCDR